MLLLCGKPRIEQLSLLCGKSGIEQFIAAWKARDRTVVIAVWKARDRTVVIAVWKAGGMLMHAAKTGLQTGDQHTSEVFSEHLAVESCEAGS